MSKFVENIDFMGTVSFGIQEKKAKASAFHGGLYESKIRKQEQMKNDVKTPEYQEIIEKLKQLNKGNVSI